VAVNRTKVLEAAQKFLSKGQYDKAVAEYQKLVQEDPRDVRTLLKIGDLHTRRNKPKDAIDVYQKVADLYAKQGFFLKAVAVYKQILKLDPAHLDTTQKLAKMYEELALTSDALTTYEAVADAYAAQGQMPKALETMARMIELDGQNVAVRIKYAEALSRANKPREAAQAFAAGALLLKEQGRMDDYLRVVERQLYHDAENVGLARELAGLYLERSDPKRALAKLQICFKADPRDVQTLEMLAESFRQLGQTAKTVSVLKEIARLHAEAGSDEPRRRTLKRVLDLDPNDAEAKQALGTVKSTAAARPTAAPPRRPMAAPPPPPPPAIIGGRPVPPPPRKSAPTDEIELEPEAELDLVEDESASSEEDVLIVDEPSLRPPALAPRDEQIGSLLSEADAHEGAGDYEGALSALSSVLELEPNHVAAHERLKDIYLAADRRVDAVKELLWLSNACEELNFDRAVHYARAAFDLAPRSEATRRKLSALGVATPDEVESASSRARLDQLESDDELDAILPPVSARPEAIAPAQQTLGAAELLELPLRATDFDARPPARPARTLSADDIVRLLALSFTPEEFAQAATPSRATRVDDDAPSLEFAPIGTSEVSISEPPEEDEFASSPAEDTDLSLPEPALPQRDEAARARASERPFAQPRSTEKQAYAELDEGPDPTVPGEPVPELVRRAGYVEPSHADIELPSEPAVFEPPAQTVAPEPASGARAVETLTPEIEEVLGEASFFAEQGMYDEALELIQESILIFPKSAALKQRLAEYEDKADQKEHSELASESSADESFDIAEQLANGLVEVEGEGAGDDMIDVESVFAQFKKGVAEQIAPDDSETHFDLGIAYKEMGLMADAINEFELAAKGKRRACTALTMIGMCHLERGDTEAAIGQFQRALRNEHRSPPEELALQYELASAYEKLGRLEDALAAFESVAERDRSYRGVGTRLDQLRKRGARSAGARR
jgi:pilus assembly protein FimV